ncbi:hypothetical protein TRVL_06057 [Trypanosoma vivax]|nr:hypothetical protein TRVL_06057 [Trypanosoma vivax]
MRVCPVLCWRPSLNAAAMGANTVVFFSSCGKTIMENECSAPSSLHPKRPSPLPIPMRGSFIDRRPASAFLSERHAAPSYRRHMVSSADLSHRPMDCLLGDEAAMMGNETPLLHSDTKKGKCRGQLEKQVVDQVIAVYGDRLQELSARWAAKFYGQVTFGPRNYPYPSSRWLARRFKMKKHKIIKRFRFRRYKLAAVANLPFAKMIRVGMLPELKSSKTKKGDVVDAALSGQLVSAARSAGDKKKGQRSRPKSKYQV